MPDPAAPDITATKVLPSSERNITAPAFTTENDATKKITAAQKDSNEIADLLRSKPEDLSAVFAERVKPPEYTEEDLKTTTDKLKSGDTDLEISSLLEPMARFLEASRKAQINGEDITITDEDKEKIAKLILKQGRLLEKWPDLAEAYKGNDNQKLAENYVFDLMAQDPQFQLEMAKVLKEIHDAAKGLENVGESEEQQALKRQKEPIEKARDLLVSQIKTTLGQRGLDEPAQARIEELIKGGLESQDVIPIIESEMGIDSSFDEYKKFDDAYHSHNTEVALLEVQVRELQDKLNNPNIKNKDAIQKQYDQAKGNYAKAVDRSGAAARQRDSHKEAYMLRNKMDTNNQSDQTKFTQNLQKHLSARPLLETGGQLTIVIESAIRNQGKLADIEQKLKTLEGTAVDESGAEKRLELTRQLEASVDAAMSNFLKQKYENYITRQKIQTDADIKEAEKNGQDWKAARLKDLKASQDAISGFDPKARKFYSDRETLGQWKNILIKSAAESDDPSREVFAKAVGFDTNPTALKNNITNETFPTTGGVTTYDNLDDTQKAKIDKIAEERTLQFNEIFTEHGEKFTERLLTEFNNAEGFADKFSRGKLNLSDDERTLLAEKFGPIMEKTLENSSIYKELKKKGIVPDTKLKWAIFLATILGLGIAAITVAPTVVAAGAAVKGAGGALLS